MSTLLNMLVPVAWAAGDGAAHSSSLVDLVFPSINFLILLYLAKRYAVPPLREHLKKRRESMINSVAEANEARSRAEKYLQNYKSLLENLAEESAKIRDGLRAEGEREKARMISEAEAFTARLKADADLMAEQEITVARQQIRGELASLAEEAAERAVASHLTDADQDRLISDFAQQLRNS